MWELRKGKTSLGSMPEEMCKMFLSRFQTYIGAAFIRIILSNFLGKIYTGGKLTGSILTNSYS